MVENNKNNETKSTSGKLPLFGDFVGRERELCLLEEFLTGDSSVPSIMLVHGPRGMGKSALVHLGINNYAESTLPFADTVCVHY